jgi:hypothetical protein
MAAISSNGTGGGNYSNPASWAGGVVPTLATLDDVTIVAGDTITIDTTGLGCRRISSLAGTLTWLDGATTEFTVGDGLADNLITFGANGYFKAGDTATPLTGFHTVILNGLVASQAATGNHLNMSACNTTTSGISIVCDATIFGVTESYTHPITGIVYNTRRNYTQIASQVNIAQADVVFAENLKLRAGGGDILIFPSSHISTNGQLNNPQNRTTASYDSGTLTATVTSNFTTQIAVNAITGVPKSGARAYSETSVFTIRAINNTKYWGFTGAASTNPIFNLQNCTLKWFNGSASNAGQFNNKILQGVVLIGPAVSITNNAMGIRANTTSQPLTYISCVFDCFTTQNTTSQIHLNNFFCIAVRNVDIYNVMPNTEFYDCYFQDVIQAIANSQGTIFTNCGFLQVNNAMNGTLAVDCHANAILSQATAVQTIRPTYGRLSILVSGLGIESPRYIESANFTGTIGNIFSDVNSRASIARGGSAAQFQSPFGPNSPSTIGIKLAPGGNTTGFTTPPDAIPPPPSGATIYNRLITTTAIAPTAINEPFRPARHQYQIIVTANTAYSFTVPILSVSGYIPTSLTVIKLTLTWSDGSSISTTVTGLIANVWSLINVSGVAPVSGGATLTYYIQANLGSIYIDYPLQMISSGYSWSNGQPTVAQTPLTSPGLVNDIVTAIVNEIEPTLDELLRASTFIGLK